MEWNRIPHDGHTGNSDNTNPGSSPNHPGDDSELNQPPGQGDGVGNRPDADTDIGVSGPPPGDPDISDGDLGVTGVEGPDLDGAPYEEDGDDGGTVAYQPDDGPTTSSQPVSPVDEDSTQPEVEEQEAVRDEQRETSEPPRTSDTTTQGTEQARPVTDDSPRAQDSEQEVRGGDSADTPPDQSESDHDTGVTGLSGSDGDGVDDGSGSNDDTGVSGVEGTDVDLDSFTMESVDGETVGWEEQVEWTDTQTEDHGGADDWGDNDAQPPADLPVVESSGDGGPEIS